jgi:hypothetical protein
MTFCFLFSVFFSRRLTDDELETEFFFIVEMTPTPKTMRKKITQNKDTCFALVLSLIQQVLIASLLSFNDKIDFN